MRRRLIALMLAGLSPVVNADVIQGKTFSVTTDFDYFRVPPYGYVTPGPAIAGMWGNQSEWIAGRSEFLLAKEYLKNPQSPADASH